MDTPRMKVGGQAVIEGVMMKTERRMAVAVRVGKKIRTFPKKLPPHSFWHTVPIVRGIRNLAEMLRIGMEALNLSANVSAKEDEQLSGFAMFLTMALSLVFAVALFKFVPLLLAQLLVGKTTNTFLFALLDGLIKIAVFFIYVAVIGRMKDILRVFQYHGAEHMTVHCYEAKRPLTVKNIRRYSPIHPRCGTTFIMLLLIVSILGYALIPMSYSFLAKLIMRLLLLPLFAGIAYEIIRLDYVMRGSPVYGFFILPGILFQRLTTAVPDDEQIEVAVAALKKVV